MSFVGCACISPYTIGYAVSMIHEAVGFAIGEEVIYDEERYIVAGYEAARVTPYRLLATTSQGAKVVWSSEADLQAIASYVTPCLDTGTPE